MYITSPSYYYEFDMNAAVVVPRSPPPITSLIPIETGGSFVNTAWMIRNDGGDTAFLRGPGADISLPAGNTLIVEWTEANGSQMRVIGGPFLTNQGVLRA